MRKLLVALLVVVISVALMEGAVRGFLYFKYKNQLFQSFFTARNPAGPILEFALVSGVSGLDLAGGGVILVRTNQAGQPSRDPLAPDMP